MADKTLTFFKTWGQFIAYVASFLIFVGMTYEKFQEYDKRITRVESVQQTITRIDANLQMTMKQLKIEPIMGKENE